MTTQKALIYCRVSSERQKTEGHGLDGQEQRCRLYCEQKGYEIEKRGVFRDSASGGGDFMKRPAMRDLLAFADAHPHQNYVVVFDDLTRFARDTAFHLKLRMEFKIRGLKPECLNFNFEDTPEGEFIEVIIAASGELGRKQNRRTVIQKQRARLELGYWPFNPIPGYIHIKTPGHGKLLTEHEPEAAIIKEALEGFAVDRFQTQGDVQRFFEKKNYSGKKKIHFQLANRLFTRISLYAGFIEYTPWEVARRKGHHKPMIDMATYEKLKAKLEDRAPLRTRKDVREDFPLRGTVVVCAKCEHSLTASYTTKKKKPGYRQAYYRCNNLNCEERKKSIRRDVLETRFKALLQGIKPKPLVLKVTEAIFFDLWEKRMANFSIEEEVGIKEQREIQTDIKTLVQKSKKAVSERVVREYEKEIDELVKQEEKLQQMIGPSSPKKIDFRTALRMVFDYLEDPYSHWENGDLSERQMVLQLVFQGVIPYDREKGFGTAPLALPLRVFEHFATSNSQGVDVVKNNWNALESFIFDWGERLRERNMAHIGS